MMGIWSLSLFPKRSRESDQLSLPCSVPQSHHQPIPFPPRQDLPEVQPPQGSRQVPEWSSLLWVLGDVPGLGDREQGGAVKAECPLEGQG